MRNGSPNKFDRVDGRNVRAGWATIALICVLCETTVAKTTSRMRTVRMAEAQIGENMHSAQRTVIDESGRTVRVPVNVRRIVTLAPNLTEIVFALGAQNRLVGVSKFSDRPESAREKPRIGMPLNPSLEAIVGARPDVVFAASVNSWDTVDSLERLGIPVYTTDPHSIMGMLRSIRDIGGVIGAQEEAWQLVQALQQRLAALKAKLANVPPIPALFVVWDNPLQSVGENTFIADALRWAGARSVVQTNQNWPLVSMEEVVKLNPEYLIYAQSTMGAHASSDSADLLNADAAVAARLKELRSQEPWRELPAVREGHIAVVSSEIDVPAPGLIDVIEQLAQELHPAIFQKSNNRNGRQLPGSNENGEDIGSKSPRVSAEEFSCTR